MARNFDVEVKLVAIDKVSSKIENIYKAFDKVNNITDKLSLTMNKLNTDTFKNISSVFKASLSKNIDKITESIKSFTAVVNNLKINELNITNLSKLFENISKTMTGSIKITNKYDQSIKNVSNTTNKYDQSIKNVSNTTNKFNAKLKDSKNSVDNSTESLKKQTGIFDNLNPRIAKFFDILGVGLSAKLTPFTAAVGLTATAIGRLVKAISEGIGGAADIQVSMVKLGNLTQKSGQDLTDLKDIAIEVGEATKFTTNEVIEAQQNLAQMGLITKDTTKEAARDLTQTIAYFSVATGQTIEQSSQQLAQISSATGMAMKSAGDWAFYMANNSQIAQKEVPKVLAKFGTLIKTQNQTTESMLALTMATRSNTGSALQSAQAIKSFGDSMIQVHKTSKRLSEMELVANTIGKTDIIYDANGQMRDMIDIIADLEKGYKILGYSQKDINTSLQTMLGNSRAITTYNSAVSEGIDKIRENASKFKSETEGIVDESAKKMGDTYTGMIERITGKLENIRNAIGEKFLPMVSEIANKISLFLENIDIDSIVIGFNDIANTISNIVIPIIEILVDIFKNNLVPIFNALKPIIINIVDGFKNFFNYLSENQHIVIGILTAISIAVIASLVPAIWSAVTAFGALTIAMMTNPFTLIVVGIGAVVAGIVWLTQNWDTTVKFLNKTISDISKWFQGLGNFFINIGNNIYNFFNNLFINIFGKERWESLNNVVKNFVNSIGKFFTDMFEQISSFFNGIIKEIKNLAKMIGITFEEVESKAKKIEKSTENIQYRARVSDAGASQRFLNEIKARPIQQVEQTNIIMDTFNVEGYEDYSEDIIDINDNLYNNLEEKVKNFVDIEEQLIERKQDIYDNWSNKVKDAQEKVYETERKIADKRMELEEKLAKDKKQIQKDLIEKQLDIDLQMRGGGAVLRTDVIDLFEGYSPDRIKEQMFDATKSAAESLADAERFIKLAYPERFETVLENIKQNILEKQTDIFSEYLNDDAMNVFGTVEDKLTAISKMYGKDVADKIRKDLEKAQVSAYESQIKDIDIIDNTGIIELEEKQAELGKTNINLDKSLIKLEDDLIKYNNALNDINNSKTLETMIDQDKTVQKLSKSYGDLLGELSWLKALNTDIGSSFENSDVRLKNYLSQLTSYISNFSDIDNTNIKDTSESLGTLGNKIAYIITTLQGMKDLGEIPLDLNLDKTSTTYKEITDLLTEGKSVNYIIEIAKSGAFDDNLVGINTEIDTLTSTPKMMELQVTDTYENPQLKNILTGTGAYLKDMNLKIIDVTSENTQLGNILTGTGLFTSLKLQENVQGNLQKQLSDLKLETTVSAKINYQELAMLNKISFEYGSKLDDLLTRGYSLEEASKKVANEMYNNLIDSGVVRERALELIESGTGISPSFYEGGIVGKDYITATNLLIPPNPYDDTLSWLQTGEYVLNKKAVDNIGEENLDWINENNKLPVNTIIDNEIRKEDININLKEFSSLKEEISNLISVISTMKSSNKNIKNEIIVNNTKKSTSSDKELLRVLKRELDKAKQLI